MPFSGASLRRRALLASFTSPRAPEVSWKRSLFHLPYTGGKRAAGGMDVLGVPEAHLRGYASRNWQTTSGWRNAPRERAPITIER